MRTKDNGLGGWLLHAWTLLPAIGRGGAAVGRTGLGGADWPRAAPGLLGGWAAGGWWRIMMGTGGQRGESLTAERAKGKIACGTGKGPFGSRRFLGFYKNMSYTGAFFQSIY